MSTDWQKILLAAVFADHLLYDQFITVLPEIAFTPGTGLALAYVPIRYLEIIISVDMDEYKNIYVISQKHTGLREV
ncbi:hypothetical protein [Escherichia coli]|uniref:hypothetical protein n=1 Tax=Escherichia coli TaxID=562 RepID=UPI002FCCBBDE